jgi:hypothetical protein
VRPVPFGEGFGEFRFRGSAVALYFGGVRSEAKAAGQLTCLNFTRSLPR